MRRGKRLLSVTFQSSKCAHLSLSHTHTNTHVYKKSKIQLIITPPWLNAFQTFHLHPAGTEVRVCATPLPSRTVQLRFHTQPHAYFTAICSPPPRIIKGSTAFDRRNKACRPAGVAATCLQRHRRGWRSLRFASARACVLQESQFTP